MFLLSKKYIQSKINKSLKGIISKSELEQMQFIFPPRPEQDDFANYAKKINKSRDALIDEVSKLSIEKQTLIEKYFG